MTHETATTCLSALALAVIAVAIYTDVRWGKILNCLTVPTIAAGLALNALSGGHTGLLHATEGATLGCALFVVAAYFTPVFGSGDAKLLLAVGACLGPTFLMWTLLYMALTGVGLAAVVSAYGTLAQPRAHSVTTGFYLAGDQAIPFTTTVPAVSLRVPYAVAIGVGALLTMVLLHAG